MDKRWTEEGWEDFLVLMQDKKLLKKAITLLNDIERNGYTGLGKPEPLKGDLSGYWSRRIDDFNRIVYKIDEDEKTKENYIEIVQCGTHYHK